MDFPIKTPEQLGQVIKSYRRSKKLTQAEAGSGVGLLQSAVSAIEADPSTVSVERLFRLLSALGLDIVLRERNSNSSNASVEW